MTQDHSQFGEGVYADEVGLLYIALARLFDKPVEAAKLASDITALAEAFGIAGFAEFFKEASGIDLEEHRVEMFELAPRCPLYGGYYATSEERGWYMYQILTYYKAFGFEVDVRKELPDYLPTMLEFLGVTCTVDEPVRRTMRRDFYLRFIKPWLGGLLQCVEKAGSPYRHLVAALRQLLELDFDIPP